MAATRSYPGWLSFILLGLLIPSLLESCGFCGPSVSGELCLLSEAPVTKSAVVPDQHVVLEVPGTLIVFHGSACAKSTKSGTKDVLKIDQSLGLPAYATNATVILNGWEVAYLNGDHHVADLGTLIDTIRIDPNRQRPTLRWQAAGVLSDDNFDDAYQWCYHFTVIAWNPTAINLFVDHTDGNCSQPNSTAGNVYFATNKNTSTALSSFASFIQNPAFANSKTVSVLPRGFDFSWGGCDVDHHMLQMAYNLGHPEMYVEAGKSYQKMVTSTVPIPSNDASQVGNGFVSWETSAIFKDNDDRRDYVFGEIVSVLGGSDLGVIEPPFDILPISGNGNASLSSPGVLKKALVITDVPYNSAVPVLTGWELHYLTDDQHVQKAGVWIDNFRYDKAPGALTGTLSYTLAADLQDEDSNPDFSVSHKVTVLGFQGTIGQEASQKSMRPIR